MARLTPQEAAKKLVERTTAAAPDYARGVSRVTVSPTESALRQIDTWSARVAAPETKDKMRRGLQRTQLNDWQQATLEKGSTRLAGGVQASQPKVERFFTQLLPHVDAGKQKIAGMPKGGVENGIARSTAFIRHMSTFKRTQ